MSKPNIQTSALRSPHKPVNKNFSHNITIIAFRRPELLETTLKMLRSNLDIQGTPLYIFIDGARDRVPEESALVKKTLECAQRFEWDGEKQIFASEKNKGLHHAVRYAIDRSLCDFESTIIVEDDIITSPFFYRFMIRSLQKFWHSERVAAVCAHVYPFSRKIFNPKSPYFLQHFACWGWATWRENWNAVEWDVRTLHAAIKKSARKREFNFGRGTAVSGLLDSQLRGEIDTWDVQVSTTFFLQDKYCLFPPETLTQNIGWRATGDASHMTSTKNINAALAYSDFILDNPNTPQKTALQEPASQEDIASSQDAWRAYHKLFYPPKLALYFFAKNIVLFFFPFLLPLAHSLRKKRKRSHRDDASNLVY